MVTLIDDNLQRYTDEQVMELISTLPSWRRDRALQFKHPAGRRECCLSYLMLCQVLNEHFGIAEPPEFDYNEHGKPMLRDHADIFFNISHCREAIACVVSHQPVGIDIERVGRGNDRLTSYVMSEAEQLQIRQSADPAVEFTRLWTMKEAIVKLRGTGITGNLKTLIAESTDVELHTTIAPSSRYVYTVAQLAPRD